MYILQVWFSCIFIILGEVMVMVMVMGRQSSQVTCGSGKSVSVSECECAVACVGDKAITACENISWQPTCRPPLWSPEAVVFGRVPGPKRCYPPRVRRPPLRPFPDPSMSLIQVKHALDVCLSVPLCRITLYTLVRRILDCSSSSLCSRSTGFLHPSQ